MKLKIILLAIFAFITLHAQTIHEKLQEDIQNEFKDDLKVWNSNFVKSNLSITFTNSHLYFTKDNSQLSDKFQVIIADFTPRFLKIIEQHKQYIQKVQILSYTSSESRFGVTKQDKYLRNLLVSQQRADTLLRFMSHMESLDKNLKNILENNFFSVGKSSDDLIFNKDGSENKGLSRRIIFSIQLNEKAFKLIEDQSKLLESFLKEKIEKPVVLVQQKTSGQKIVPDHPQQDPVEKLIKENLQSNLNSSEQNDPQSVLKSTNKILTIEDYVKRLLVENPTINEQYNLLESVNRDLQLAKSAYKPTLNYSYTYKDYETSSVDNYEKSKTHDITLNYNIFNKFKDEKQIKIDQLNLGSTKFAAQQVEIETVYSLVEAFINVVKVREFYALSRENYGDYMQWVEKEKIRFQNGLTNLRDFSKIEARSLNRYMNFEEDTKRFNDTISTMQKYVDFDDTNMVKFKVDNPTISYFDNIMKAFEDLEKYSPYIKEAKQNVQLYEAKLDKSKVTFYPTVDLIAKQSHKVDEYRDNKSDLSTFDRSISIEAKFDLYSAGKDQIDYEKKLYEYKQKIQKLEAVKRDVKYKLDLAFNKFYMLSAKNDFMNELVNKRETEHIAANYDFKFAKLDANGLLDVVDSLYNAKRLAIETKYDLILAKYEILKEMGIIKEYILNEL
ncbi:MAG: TolC family protein [Campylobacterales bacterium]|nr:TolC family protein [Campylobacterales bacterium]